MRIADRPVPVASRWVKNRSRSSTRGADRWRASAAGSEKYLSNTIGSSAIQRPERFICRADFLQGSPRYLSNQVRNLKGGQGAQCERPRPKRDNCFQNRSGVAERYCSVQFHFTCPMYAANAGNICRRSFSSFIHLFKQ